MAKVTITPVKLSVNDFQDFVWTEGSVDGFKIPMTENDQKMCVMFYNSASSAASVTVNKGNGLQAVADLAAYSIGAGEYCAVMLESGPFKNVAGEDQDYCIIVPSAATVKCAVVVLP